MKDYELTDIALTLLAVIGKTPMNGYKLIKILSSTVKESTVYAALRNLEKKGLISGEIRHETNMPAKKVYSLTEEGRRLLEYNLVNSLESLESSSSSFEKAIKFICTISKGEAVKAVQRHRKKLEQELSHLQSIYSEYRINNSIPFTVKVLTRQMIKKRQVELDTLNELQKGIEWDREWNHFPLDFMHV